MKLAIFFEAYSEFWLEITESFSSRSELSIYKTWVNLGWSNDQHAESNDPPISARRNAVEQVVLNFWLLSCVIASDGPSTPVGY